LDNFCYGNISITETTGCSRVHCVRAKRGAAVMSLIQSAKLNGHDPYAYLKDVLTRLPTQRASQIHELLPHRWQPQIQAI
jgi:hypothetical protein